MYLAAGEAAEVECSTAGRAVEVNCGAVVRQQGTGSAAGEVVRVG